MSSPEVRALIAAVLAELGPPTAGEGFPNPVAALFQAGNTLVINGSGLFIYDGIPAAGNLVGYWATAPGTDPWGNAFTANLTVGVDTGPQVQLIPHGSGGQAGAVVALPTNSDAELNIANMYAVRGNPGLATEYLILGLTGPTNIFDGEDNGMQIQLISKSGDGTILPGFLLYDNNGNYYLATAGSLSFPQLGIGTTFAGVTPVNQAPAQVTLNGAVLMYSAGGTQTAVFTGSGTFPQPAGVATARVQAWGGSAGGKYSSGPGGGSGEYAEEAALALAGPLTVTIGAGGLGGTSASSQGKAGANTTVTGGGVPVTAHGAPATGGGSTSAGGSGSTNTIHRNGSGSSGTLGAGQGGGGGAGSPGATGSGVAGHANSGRSPGAGGAAGAGGGAAGGGAGWGATAGITGATAGAPGTVPGAGGGASGGIYSGTGPPGGAGAAGKVIITWTAPGGTALQASAASAALTDPLGNTAPAGFQGPIVAVAPATSPSAPETWHTLGSFGNGWTTAHGRYRLTADGSELEIDIALTGSGTAGIFTFPNTLPVSYRPAITRRLPGVPAAGAACHATISTAGAVSGTVGAGGSATFDCCGRVPLD